MLAVLLECNPHRDRAFDARHSQLELLLFILACNPHKDRALDVRHSQLELLLLFLACNPHRDRALDLRHSQLKALIRNCVFRARLQMLKIVEMLPPAASLPLEKIVVHK